MAPQERQQRTSPARKQSGTRSSAKKTTKASKQIERALQSPSELAFGELTAAFNGAQRGCTDLATDGRIRHLQASFWALSNACLVTLLRVDGVWTRIVDSTPVADIKLHAALASEANASVKLAISKPKSAHLLDAIAKVGLANDQISALFDRAEAR